MGNIWFAPPFFLTAFTKALILKDLSSKSPLPSIRCRNRIALKRFADVSPPFFITVCSHVRKLRISRSQLRTAVFTRGRTPLASQKRVRISHSFKYVVCASASRELIKIFTVSPTNARFAAAFRHVCVFNFLDSIRPHQYRKTWCTTIIHQGPHIPIWVIFLSLPSPRVIWHTCMVGLRDWGSLRSIHCIPSP